MPDQQTLTKTRIKTKTLVKLLVVGGAILAAAAFSAKNYYTKTYKTPPTSKLSPPTAQSISSPLFGGLKTFKILSNTEVGQLKSDINTLNQTLNDIAVKASDKKSQEKFLTLLKLRKEKLGDLVKSNPGAMASLDVSALQSKLPKNLANLVKEKGLVEEKVTLDGKLEQIHQDSFNDQTSRDFFFLRTADGQRLPVYPSKLQRTIKPGSIVKAGGWLLHDVGLISSENMGLISAAQSPGISEEKVAVIVIKFADSIGCETYPDAPTILNNTFFGAGESVKKFIEETSYDQATISGVIGCITLPETFQYYLDLPMNEYGQTVVDAFDSQIDWTGYSHIVTYRSSNDCGGSGTTWKIPFSTDEGPINASFAEITNVDPGCLSRVNTATHELMHGFGLQHAGGWICPSLVGENLDDPKSGCQTPQYDDDMDIMGAFKRQLSASRKEELGWLGTANSQVINSSGNYTLKPAEESSAGIKHIKIPLGGDKFYSIEYRRSNVGFDSGTNNLLIRYIPENLVITGAGPMSTLRPKNFEITEFAIFYDPYRHINVTLVERSESQATINIDLNAPQPPIDLFVNYIMVLPVSQVIGLPPTFKGRIKNSSLIGAPASVARLRLDIANDGVWDMIQVKNLTPLDPGKDILVEWVFWAALPGIHKFEICADMNSVGTGQINESNEGNNCSSMIFEVPQISTLADLIIQTITVSPTTSTVVGQPITVNATVKNLGANVGLTTTRLIIDVGSDGGATPDITQTIQTNPLATDGTKVETWNNVWTATLGNHQIEVCANITGVYPESNSNNNCTLYILSVK